MEQEVKGNLPNGTQMAKSSIVLSRKQVLPLVYITLILTQGGSTATYKTLDTRKQSNKTPPPIMLFCGKAGVDHKDGGECDPVFW